MKDTETTTINQLEIDNAYLKQQNEHLTKELSFTRYTIKALKNIANQRDVSLNETRQELERALQHIQLLSFTIRQQQQRHSSLSGIGPQLVNDDLSSDDQELSEEEVEVELGRPTINIMSKLPLRHNSNNEIIINQDY